MNGLAVHIKTTSTHKQKQPAKNRAGLFSKSKESHKNTLFAICRDVTRRCFETNQGDRSNVRG